MKRLLIFISAILAVFIMPTLVYAAEGDSGYEGGISGQLVSSTKANSVFKYQEVVFITGKPVILSGTLTIKKKLSNNTETDTYTYALSDTNKDTLARTVTLVSQVTTQGGTTTRATSLDSKYSETIVIDGKTYALKNYSLTKSSVVDARPGVSYFAGNLQAVKTYALANSPNVTITLKVNGNNDKNQFSGYNQIWSSGEVQINNYDLSYESTTANGPIVWNGNAKVKLSSTSTTDLKYVQNYPDEISFGGDYIQSQSAISKLTYEINMPEFDKDGLPTDRIVTKKGSFQLSTFPTQKSLAIQDLSSIRGHWAVDDITRLYSLGIYDDDPDIFMPDQYMSRAEFAKALSKAANITDTSTSNKKTKTKIVSPYADVPVNDPYFTYIQQLSSKGVMSGFNDGNFHPYDTITRAQAIEAFIKVLGLEEVAKDKYPVTIFKDNDDIPSWALRSIAAAYKIGIIKGDNGYLRPNVNITKAEAATLINRLIDYMRKDMAKSYSDKILNY